MVTVLFDWSVCIFVSSNHLAVQILVPDSIVRLATKFTSFLVGN